MARVFKVDVRCYIARARKWLWEEIGSITDTWVVAFCREDENVVAIDLITEHIRMKLQQHDLRRIYHNLQASVSDEYLLCRSFDARSLTGSHGRILHQI